jgi:antitoxin HicB
MSGMRYTYPARLEADEDGRLVVHFADLPEALTDGADQAEALAEASDCLSEALAGRIHRQEQIPIPRHWRAACTLSNPSRRSP